MNMRHGDVVLVPTDNIPEGAEKKDHLILAYGEKTGHKHAMDVGELFETKDGGLFLKVDKLAKIDHQEHPASPVAPGIYGVVIKRQYTTDGGWTKVVD